MCIFLFGVFNAVPGGERGEVHCIQSMQPAINSRHPKHLIFLIVITSYSIHYTKLYERAKRIAAGMRIAVMILRNFMVDDPLVDIEAFAATPPN